MARHSPLPLTGLGRRGRGGRRTVAIYVYTYELQYDEGTAGDQIYGAMNRAMRTDNAREVEFWRPYMWELARALEGPGPSPCSRTLSVDGCTITPPPGFPPLPSRRRLGVAAAHPGEAVPRDRPGGPRGGFGSLRDGYTGKRGVSWPGMDDIRRLRGYDSRPFGMRSLDRLTALDSLPLEAVGRKVRPPPLLRADPSVPRRRDPVSDGVRSVRVPVWVWLGDDRESGSPPLLPTASSIARSTERAAPWSGPPSLPPPAAAAWPRSSPAGPRAVGRD